MGDGNRERYAEADIIRALSVIYIVGVWHLQEYSPLLPQVSRLPGAYTFTYFCLGMFFFVSGFLLASAYGGLTEIASVLSFYGKRLLRLYPLYAAALAGFYFAGIGLVTLEVLVDSIFLVAIFLNRAPLTLWFVHLILLYYLAAPLLVSGGRHRYGWWLFFAVLTCGLLLFDFQTGLIDDRFFQYIPSFGLGLLLGSEPRLLRRVVAPRAIAAATAACAAILAIGSVSGAPGKMAIWAFCPPLLAPAVWVTATAIARQPQVFAVCQTIGYLSYAAYLIHRLTFELGRAFYPDTPIAAWVYWVGLVLPCTFAAAYALQLLYDRVILPFPRNLGK